MIEDPTEDSLDEKLKYFRYYPPEPDEERGMLAWLHHIFFQALVGFLDFIAPSSRNPPAPSQHSRGRP